MEPTDIPPVGVIQGISRKESPYDTEVIIAAAVVGLPALIRLFQNFNAFQVGGAVPIAKQDGRDTNLGGSTSALPQGYQLEWYEWRASVETLDANLGLVANVGVFEQMNRIRELGFIRYLATQSPLITSKLTDVVSFVDSKFVNTTIGASTIISPAVTARGGKVIAVGGEPYTVRPQEQFSINAGWPGALGVAFTATVTYYLISWLDGILTRAS